MMDDDDDDDDDGNERRRRRKGRMMPWRAGCRREAGATIEGEKGRGRKRSRRTLLVSLVQRGVTDTYVGLRFLSFKLKNKLLGG